MCSTHYSQHLRRQQLKINKYLHMKLVLFFCLLLFCISSCKKDRTCVCENSSGSYNAGVINDYKIRAKKNCKALSVGATNCHLK